MSWDTQQQTAADLNTVKLEDPAQGLWVIARGFGPESISREEARQVAEDVQFFVLRGIHDQDSTFPFVIRSYLSLPGNVLFNSILFANHRLNRRNQKRSIHDRVAVSVSVAFREGARVAIANVGVGCANRHLPGAELTSTAGFAAMGVPLVVPRSYASFLPSAESCALFHDVPLVALGMGKDDFEPEIAEIRLGEDERVTLGMGLDRTEVLIAA